MVRAILAAIGIMAAASMPVSAADVEKGKKVFKKCISCHAVGEKAKRKVGPPLNGIIGKKAAQFEGYKYSKAMVAADLTWDEETLASYLKSPRKFLKGTKMSFGGLKKDEQIADVIAYLAQYNDDGTTK